MNPSALIIWLLMGCFCNSVPWISARLIRSVNPPPSTNMCMTETCRHSAEEIISKMDTAVDPCDNFYKFTCGNFLRENIPATDDERVDSLTENVPNNQMRNKMKDILEEASPPDELNAFKLMKKYYKACMNEASILEKGWSSLLDMLKRLGPWPILDRDNWVEDDFSWTETVYKMAKAGYRSNYLIDLQITYSVKNNTNQKFLMLVPPPFLSIDSSNNKRLDPRLNYFDPVMSTLTLLGVDLNYVKLSQIREIADFHSHLAYISFPPSDNTRMTLTQLTRKYPTIAWKEFFQRMLPANIIVDENEKIFVQNPTYIFYLEMLLGRTPKRVQANFLMYQVILESLRFCSLDDNSIIIQLNREILESGFQVNNNMTDQHRREECLDMILLDMPTSLAALYIRKNFTMDMRRNIGEMIEDITKQYRILLQNADWMDDRAQKQALDKLDSMTSVIGYPDQLFNDVKFEEDYKGLVLDENDYFHSYLNLSRFRKESSLRNLRAPVNENDTYPDNYQLFEELSSVYDPKQNKICK